MDPEMSSIFERVLGPLGWFEDDSRSSKRRVVEVSFDSFLPRVSLREFVPTVPNNTKEQQDQFLAFYTTASTYARTSRRQ